MAGAEGKPPRASPLALRLLPVGGRIEEAEIQTDAKDVGGVIDVISNGAVVVAKLAEIGIEIFDLHARIWRNRRFGAQPGSPAVAGPALIDPTP